LKATGPEKPSAPKYQVLGSALPRHPRRGHPFGLAPVWQTNHLIDWAIAGLIVIGGLFYFFGPVVLRTDDVIAVGLVILVLIGIRLGLRR
jgi:hypothetical protein